VRLVNRAEWGARPPQQRQLLAKNEQKGTAVHYTAADADEQADHLRCAGRVRGIQAFHIDGRGWSDIAYSYLVCKHGYVFEGRCRGIRTAAQGTNDGNDGYHAVCFLGDDSAGRDDVTDPGRAAMRDAVIWCNAWAGVDEIRPHSSFHSTACPGDDLRVWITAGMPQPEEEDDMPFTRDEIKAMVREVLNEGTASGQTSWATTSKNTLRVGQETYNEAKGANDQGATLDAIASRVTAIEGDVDRLAAALIPPPGTVP
jgi:hypothetical protein